MTATPFAHWSGRRDARIVLLGEAWGRGEDETKRPFSHDSGKELWRMLGEAWPNVWPEEHARVQALHSYGLGWIGQRDPWLHAASLAMTNVFNLRPRGNKIEELFDSRAATQHSTSAHLPPLRLGKYLRPEYMPELERLYAELATCRPNLIVALGATACWATLWATNISQIRGTTAQTHAQVAAQVGGEPLKVLPTFHPASLLYEGQWSRRPIIVADLMKALRESQFADVRRPARRILINPTLQEVIDWTEETLQGHMQGRYIKLSPDIETAFGQITCIGFARARNDALVIPFVDRTQAGWSYWPTAAEERIAWECTFKLLQSSISKVGQNFLYDMQYLLRMPTRINAMDDDTMLLHHSLFPELQKGLGFLGSIYTSEPAWKLMRRQRTDTEKRDE